VSYLLHDPILTSPIEQRKLLLSTPILLSALLNVCIARNYLTPTISAMRLHSYLAQAIPLDAPARVRLTQLPSITKADIDAISPRPKDLDDVYAAFSDTTDEKAVQVKKAIEKWGRVEIVDASFKGTLIYIWLQHELTFRLVIGERVVSPNAIVFFVVKLRLTPPGLSTEQKDLSVEDTKRVVKENEEKDEELLLSKNDAEEVLPGKASGYAHTPYWPAVSDSSTRDDPLLNISDRVVNQHGGLCSATRNKTRPLFPLSASPTSPSPTPTPLATTEPTKSNSKDHLRPVSSHGSCTSSATPLWAKTLRRTFS